MAILGNGSSRHSYRRARTLLLAATVVVATTSVLNASQPAGANPQQAASQAAPGPHNDLFAVVSADGTVSRATLGTVVTHTAGSGRYDVHFARSVAGCSATANLGYTGNHEAYTFPAVVAVGRTAQSGTIAVDVTYPGDTVAGRYPHFPVLSDNSFHLHVQCGPSGQHVVVTQAGIVASGSGGTSAVRTAKGLYAVTFAKDVSACAPVATVRNRPDREARSAQAHLALGSSNSTVIVATNRGSLAPMNVGFELSVTCSGNFAVFSSSSGYFNPMTLTDANRCAYTGSFYDPTPAATPSYQGYVATWYSNATTTGIQTKNGGYGINAGYPVDIVATC